MVICMGFLKQKWGYMLALVLILVTAGAVWYLLFYGGVKDYTGGMLVRLQNMAKEMM